ncbi:peptidoglycan-binding domain-containing protein [Micromonospora sp. NPDC051296]|uniref:peptidoglycan-binding domain-containing protein n=1 Tax=Micromonospora sp. NPDC051296 TaxID=3155046 RepID=UPI0034304D72
MGTFSERNNMNWKRISAVAVALSMSLASLAIAQPAQAGNSYISQYCKTNMYVLTYSGSASDQPMWCRVQHGPAAAFGYTGPADGYPGVNTWKGVQSYLRASGVYSGPVDGIPGTNTYKGIQLIARHGGYNGPIDGIPGANTWRGFDMAIRVGWFGL